MNVNHRKTTMTIDNDFLRKIREIQVVKSSMSRTIKDLLSEFQSGKIRIPEYQRSFVWERDKQCRFIESIFLQVPVPPIFLLEKYDQIDEEDGIETMIYEVIDGVQRLTTLANFDSGKLTLSALERLQDLNQAKISQLPLQVKDFFLGRSLDVICIQSGTNPEVQFEVFGRLNQGAVALNAQELRNCMFHGYFNDFLIELSRDLTYRELLKYFPKFRSPVEGKPDKNRMQDVEMILRFFSLIDFYDEELNKYPEPRTETLNEYMRNQVKKTEIDQEYLENCFVDTLKLVQIVFSPDHFRSFLKKADKSYFTTSLNQAVFDVQMLGFLDIESDLVSQHKEVIKETFIDLCCYDRDFNEAISRSTNTKISERVSIWKQKLVEIFSNPNPYYEKLNLKKKIFTDNAICASTGMAISSFEYGDIYQGKLCHRSSLNGNDIFQPREEIVISRRTTNSPTMLIIANQSYEVDNLKEGVKLVLSYIKEEIESDSYEYHSERIKNLEFCGSPKQLSSLSNGGNIQMLPITGNLYFKMGTRVEIVSRLNALASLFSSMQPFEIK